MGCSVMAGLGAAVNTGGVSRGDSVAVFGCGGVGDAAIAGARLAGAHTIFGVDIDERKLEWAKEFGATHTINATQADAVEAIRELTGGQRRRCGYRSRGQSCYIRAGILRARDQCRGSSDGGRA